MVISSARRYSSCPKYRRRILTVHGGMQSENMYGTYFTNPVAEALMRENYEKGLQLYVDFFADITLYKGLVFRAEYAGNYYYNNNYQYTPSYDYGLYTQESLGSRSASNGSNWTLKDLSNLY